MPNADTQCTVRESGGQRAEKIVCLNFSCLAIKYEFYFIRVAGKNCPLRIPDPGSSAPFSTQSSVCSFWK